MAKLRDITREEWDQYEWIEVTTMADPDPIYVRGRMRTAPPNDGYVYEDCTGPSDQEQKWKRVKTPVVN